MRRARGSLDRPNLSPVCHPAKRRLLCALPTPLGVRARTYGCRTGSLRARPMPGRGGRTRGQGVWPLTQHRLALSPRAGRWGPACPPGPRPRWSRLASRFPRSARPGGGTEHAAAPRPGAHLRQPRAARGRGPGAPRLPQGQPSPRGQQRRQQHDSEQPRSAPDLRHGPPEAAPPRASAPPDPLPRACSARPASSRRPRRERGAGGAA